jgi:hypothetical protein
MYYPSHQIKSNLYTNGGELQYAYNNEDYIGFYYGTSNGEFYTGRHNQDGSNYRLVSLIPNIGDTNSQPIGSNETYNNSIWVINDDSYNKIKSIENGTSQENHPSPIFPTPTKEDYDLGETTRYFLKKTNEIKFIEISNLEYGKYVSRSENVPYQLYIPFTLIWELKGDIQQVNEINYKTVKRVEESQKLYGLEQYFKGNFTQLYKS